MATTNALTFLQSVSGYAQSLRDSSADKPIRLATIDPSFDPFVNYPNPPPLPKVTFDGESTLSGKQYPYVNGYVPAPGNRVWMVPVGTTYLICGLIENPGLQGWYRDGATYGIELGNGNYYDNNGGLVLSNQPLTVSGKRTISNVGGLSAQAQGSFSTTSTSYVDLGAPSSFSFTKYYSSSDTQLDTFLRIGSRVGTAPASVDWAIRINGTDYQIDHYEHGVNNQHDKAANWRMITGIPAGTYTVQVRVKSTGGTNIVMDSNDWISCRMAEVSV